MRGPSDSVKRKEFYHDGTLAVRSLLAFVVLLRGQRRGWRTRGVGVGIHDGSRQRRDDER